MRSSTNSFGGHRNHFPLLPFGTPVLNQVHGYPPLEQGGIILSWAKDREAADQFRSYVLGERGREILKQYGFFFPEK